MKTARVCVLAAVVSGCGGGSSKSAPTAPSAPSVVSVAISGTATLSNTNQTSQLKATATLSSSVTQNVTETAGWQSSSPAVATVSGTGLVTAIGKGTATITATYQGTVGRLAFSSGMAETTAVAISGAGVLADSNQTSQLHATATLADGTIHDITEVASWQSSNANVATVSTTGLVTAVASGTTMITAGYRGQSGTLSVSSGVTSRNIASCGTLTSPGRYVVTTDLGGSGFGQAGTYCLHVSGSNIELQCDGHVVPTIQVGGIIPGGQTIAVTNARVSNCTSQALVVNSGANVQLIGNRMTWLRATAPIILTGGRNNVVARNDIDGGSDGVFNNRIGADDGIALFDETGDIVQDNIIRNVFDAAFESIGALTNTTIANNTMTNMGYTAVGAYHSTSWRGNTVRGNIVSRAPNFAVLEWADDPGSRQTQVFFQSNTIEGNTLTNRTSTSWVLDARFPNPGYPLSLPLTTGNNLLRNNDFGSTGLGVILAPTSAFIDGGGNTWPTPVTPFQITR
jgi:parallel beta helix pectate lyase-like protein/Big-like domain-containing protein